MADIRKACLKLSINLNSPYQSFADMGLFDLIDVCTDYNEIVREENRRAEREVSKYR